MRGMPIMRGMPRKTSLPCDSRQAESIRRLSRSLRFPQGVVVMAAGLAFEKLDREQQEHRLKAAERVSQSVDDGEQHPTPATAKQAHRPNGSRTARRRAG
jgi:hypothetical protein